MQLYRNQKLNFRYLLKKPAFFWLVGFFIYYLLFNYQPKTFRLEQNFVAGFVDLNKISP